MTKEQLLSRISIDPQVCFGKPCIRGHRIWVSLILDLLASGLTTIEILQEYPDLEEADILACIAYGAEMAWERYVEIPLEAQG
jgi:uncharacterized protein (DUF433 family)